MQNSRPFNPSSGGGTFSTGDWDLQEDNSGNLDFDHNGNTKAIVTDNGAVDATTHKGVVHTDTIKDSGGANTGPISVMGNSISNTQAGYVAAMDQGVSTGDAPNFVGLDVTNSNNNANKYQNGRMNNFVGQINFTIYEDGGAYKGGPDGGTVPAGLVDSWTTISSTTRNIGLNLVKNFELVPNIKNASVPLTYHLDVNKLYGSSNLAKHTDVTITEVRNAGNPAGFIEFRLKATDVGTMLGTNGSLTISIVIYKFTALNSEGF